MFLFIYTHIVTSKLSIFHKDKFHMDVLRLSRLNVVRCEALLAACEERQKTRGKMKKGKFRLYFLQGERKAVYFACNEQKNAIIHGWNL